MDFKFEQILKSEQISNLESYSKSEWILNFKRKSSHKFW
jgi:hypothetical protein